MSAQAPLFFGPSSRPLAGWLARPQDGTARGGVILCPPLGQEIFSTHRTLRRLADELAAAGLVALRFDYESTGDSAGHQDEPGRVAAWLQSIGHARSYLRELGIERISAVGIRMGATLAAAYAVTEPWDRLVLWDPCAEGRGFIRESEALYVLGEGAGLTLDPEFRHTPGFQFRTDTATELRTVNLARLPATPLAESVLVLEREDRPLPDAVLARLRTEQLSEKVAIGQAELMDVAPSDSTVPAAAITEVVDWLSATTPVRVAYKTPRLDTTAEVEPGVQEHIGTLGTRGLVTITTEPTSSPAPATTRRPWVVLVNTTTEHHIGPGRRWVQLAREWAGEGMRCLRLDQSGVGDSPTPPGQRDDLGFAPSWIDDMRDLIGSLRQDGSPVILVGLCSGAYSSLEATQWTRVEAVLAVNPRLTLYPAARGSAAYTSKRRAAIVPAISPSVLPAKRREGAWVLWRIYRQLAVWAAPARILGRVLRRGTRLHIVACTDDARDFTEVVAWRRRLLRWQRNGRLTFTEASLLDHSLLGRDAQEYVRLEATQFVRAMHQELA